MSASIKTPLTYEDAMDLVSHLMNDPWTREEQMASDPFNRSRVRAARLLMAVDVASREQAVPDYARLSKLLSDTEGAVRGTADVQERLALVDELAAALRECRDLFARIRSDWEDPRIECRAGMARCDAAIAKAGAK